jgi:hypothetical protein
LGTQKVATRITESFSRAWHLFLPPLFPQEFLLRVWCARIFFNRCLVIFKNLVQGGIGISFLTPPSVSRILAPNPRRNPPFETSTPSSAPHPLRHPASLRDTTPGNPFAPDSGHTATRNPHTQVGRRIHITAASSDRPGGPVLRVGPGGLSELPAFNPNARTGLVIGGWVTGEVEGRSDQLRIRLPVGS